MERVFGREGIGSVVDHVLRFMTNSQNAVRAALDGHNGRFVDHDSLPADADKRICSSEVDCHIV